MRNSLLSAVALTALLIGGLAQPALAGDTPSGPTVWYVDDDGLGTAQGCKGSQPIPDTIQDAVNLAAPYDTVKVCPGTYVEQVDVAKEGLRLTATKPWAAVIKMPSDGTGSVVTLRDAGDLYMRWFTVLARASTPCAPPTRLIYVFNAPHARVRANHLDLDGTESLACRYQDGIVLNGSPDSLVLWNRVTDFSSVGIHMQDSAGTLVRGNTVRFLHPTLPCCVYSDSVGILTSSPNVTIRGNLVRGLPTGGNTTPVLQVGINMFGNGDVARRNVVRYANTGIQTINTIGVTIAENRVRGIFGFGISLAVAVDEHVLLNTVRAESIGINVGAGSYGSNIHDNDFRGSSDPDCRDQSTGDGTADTDNTWVDNLGDEDSPDGICSATP